MGWLERLVERLSRRRVEKPDETSGKDVRLDPMPPTAGTKPFERPPSTPTTKPLRGPTPTAGTRTFRDPGGTPSTARIHNPRRPGR
jgi:hypothetical protein